MSGRRHCLCTVSYPAMLYLYDLIGEQNKK